MIYSKAAMVEKIKKPPSVEVLELLVARRAVFIFVTIESGHLGVK